MTAAGDAVLAAAYSWVGYTENPPGSNCCVFWEPFTGGNPCGYGAWCAAFVSYVTDQAGYPLPAIDASAGFMLCSNGQIAAYQNGRAVGSAGAEPGDELIFSWEPWHMEGGIAICSYGVYAGAPAGDHTGFFAGWAGDGYMVTVEGNTSQSSWDNGGAVLERYDRYDSQICCYARHAALEGGPSTGPGPEPEEDEMTEADFARIQQIVFQTVYDLWREKEMENLDIARAQQGAHQAVYALWKAEEMHTVDVGRAQEGDWNVVRSDEYAAIVEQAARRAQT